MGHVHLSECLKGFRSLDARKSATDVGAALDSECLKGFRSLDARPRKPQQPCVLALRFASGSFGSQTFHVIDSGGGG